MDMEKARANDERLLTAVGRLTVSWAHLEFALDALILVIYRAGYNEHEPKLPRPLMRKIDFLRGAFKRAGRTPENSPSEFAFLDDVQAASDTRHDVIHGIPQYHPSDEGEAKLVRLLIHKTGWEQRHATITIASVTEAANRAYALATKARDAALRLTDGYLEHLAEQARQHGDQSG